MAVGVKVRASAAGEAPTAAREARALISPFAEEILRTTIILRMHSELCSRQLLVVLELDGADRAGVGGCGGFFEFNLTIRLARHRGNATRAGELALEYRGRQLPA
jgi:hypothetical protein